MVSDRRGFTLVEVLVSAAVLMIFLSASAVIVQIAITSIGEARVRGEATRLASERLEMARNLPYTSVGTNGGIPAGSLTSHEVVNMNGVNYTIDTAVLYVDDPYDGVAPTDILPTDYKRVRVQVGWDGAFPSRQPTVLITDIAPRGLETTVGGGTLSVLVFDSQGKPVSNATVHIDAPSLTPAVLMDAYTDIYGRVIIPGAPKCSACYHITASKTGYTSDRTYATTEVANPAKPHVTILEGKVTDVSFAIDVGATLTLKSTRSKAFSYSPVVGVQMTLVGTKEIGRDALDNPVYKVDLRPVTGSGGMVTVSNLEWDTYTISLPTTSSVDYAGSWPTSPLSLAPSDSQTFTMVVETSSPNTLLVALESDAKQPIASASVEISRSSYIATQSTGTSGSPDWSQTFFSNLTAGLYKVLIDAPGYQVATASVSVLNETLEKFTLSTPSATPNP